MALGDIFQGVIEQMLHGQTVLNVLHFRQDASDADPVASLNADIRSIVLPNLKAVQSQELTHVAVITQKIRPLPPDVALRSTAAAGPGSVVGNSQPTSIAVVLTKRTRFAGRKYRGRVYVAGVPDTHESNSTLAAANQAAWQTAANGFGSAFAWAASNFTPIVWHRATNTSDDIVSVDLRTILRNQRRRQVGRGV